MDQSPWWRYEVTWHSPGLSCQTPSPRTEETSSQSTACTKLEPISPRHEKTRIINLGVSRWLLDIGLGEIKARIAENEMMLHRMWISSSPAED